MQLLVLGLNHKTAPVSVRERFSLSEEKLRTGLRNIDDYAGIYEAVVLSTCNRSEIYIVLDDMDAVAMVRQFFFDLAGVEEETINDKYLYMYQNRVCIEHLLRVASSLDSLVIGEGQILSQVKNAYSVAREEESTSTILNLLFHRAIAAGKRVRTETRIAYNAVSISYAAVELAKQIFGDLSESKVLLLGAGKMGELTAMHLVSNGVNGVMVANRHFEKAVELAKKFSGQAIRFEDVAKYAVEADIVITSTGAPHYVIKSWQTKQVMRHRKGRKAFIIDIAVPRDVAPAVADIPGVTLYNIDDLEAVVDSNLQERRMEAEQAEKIVQEEVSSLLDRFQYLSFRPIMEVLTDRAENIRQHAMKHAMAKLPELSDEQRKVIKNMTKLIVRKLLREPMRQMNDAAGTEREAYYIQAVQDLFKLDVDLEMTDSLTVKDRLDNQIKEVIDEKENRA